MDAHRAQREMTLHALMTVASETQNNNCLTTLLAVCTMTPQLTKCWVLNVQEDMPGQCNRYTSDHASMHASKSSLTQSVKLL